MQRTSKRFEKIIKNLESKNIGFIQRNVSVQNGMIDILFIKELTQRQALSNQVIMPLIQNCHEINATAEKTIESIIYVDDCELETDEKKIQAYILSGMTVLLFSNDIKYIVANLKKVVKREIPKPETTYTDRKSVV